MQIDSKTLLCRYQYDALNRLVASAPLVQADTRRFYLKDRLTTEIQGAEQRSIMQHEDQLLAEQQHQSSTVGTRLLATDQQRSVLNVLAAAGRNPLAFTPYGHHHPENGLLSLLGFNGERPDPVTGCYLLGNGYRAFNPVLMRFNSPDSWSPFGEGGLNAYAYCVGDPVNKSDRTGHLPLSSKPSLSGIPGMAKRVSPAPQLQPIKRLNNMPNEILAKIFENLEGRDLVNVSLTSKRMKGSVDALSKINMEKLLNAGLPEHRLPIIDNVGFGEIKGIAPSAAVNTGVTQAQAQRDFPYAMTRQVGTDNRNMHYGPRPDLLPQVDPPNVVAAQIRAMNGDLF